MAENLVFGYINVEKFEARYDILLFIPVYDMNEDTSFSLRFDQQLIESCAPYFLLSNIPQSHRLQNYLAPLVKVAVTGMSLRSICVYPDVFFCVLGPYYIIETWTESACYGLCFQ